MSDKKNKAVDKSTEKNKNNQPSQEDLAMEAALNLAGWQKALADYQNLQKDMEKRLSDMNDYVSANFILELLPIFDNYQIAISHIPADEQSKSWAVGLQHILKMWEGFLAEHGIEKIKTIGSQFDPNFHESVGQITDENQADQSIVEEKLAGYSTKNKVLRPAKVIIINN